MAAGGFGVRVVVTGAGGYVGSATVAALRRAGHEVVAVLHRPGPVDGARTHVADLRSPEALAPVLAGSDVVCHLAGRTRVRESWADPSGYFQANAVGTMNLLSAMVAAGVTGLVFASTGAIYGSPLVQPMTEELPEDVPHPYAASKYAAEVAIEWVARAGRVGAVILRLFNVAGGCDPDPTRIVPRALAAAGAGEALRINGDGSAVRDLLHVDDAAAAFLAAVEQTPVAGEVRRYNIGSGVGASVGEVVAAVERVTGRHVRVEHGPPAAEPPRVVADPSRAGVELGWRPRVSQLDRIIADAWTATR